MAAVVLGMHRSGTSALAGVLGLTGFTPPRTLLPSSAVNERGFWESEPIKALNDELFTELGTTWYGLDDIPLEALGKRQISAARSRAEALLTSEFEPGSRPLIKDPRLCRLLPLWKATLAKLNARTIYAITLRSPLEVAQSLAQRNEFDADFGYLLWARYYLDAEFHTRGLPRCLIPYHGLVRDWRASLTALSSAAGASFQIEATEEQRVEDYLSAKLTHHRIADEQAFLELERLKIVQQTYRILSVWARGARESEEDFAILDHARRQLGELSGMLSKIVENSRLDRKRLTNAKAHAEGISVELGRARQAMEDLDSVRASLELQAAAQVRLEERIESAVSSLRDAIQERSALEQQLAEVRDDAKRHRDLLEMQLEQTSAELAQTVAERDDRDEQIGRLCGDAEQAQREWSRTADEFNEKLGALDSDRNAVQAELKEVKRKYRSTQHQLARDREKLRRTHEKMASVEADLDQIRQSLVWRTYSRLRKASHRGKALAKRVMGKDRKRRAQHLALLRDSSFFDREWYAQRYPDVAATGTDSALHYLTHGWREGRDPSPSFSTTAYLKSNADVVRAGINPLLHFLEFGYSEGRSLSEVPRPIAGDPAAPDHGFGPAAACASFPVEQRDPVRWRRAVRLDQNLDSILKIGGQPIGYVADAEGVSLIKAAFDRLAALSGYAASQTMGSVVDTSDVQPSRRLHDAWYVGSGRLRCRWQKECDPTIVRVYQHRPGKNGELAMVGEGVSVSDLDFIDADLANPYFPVLFVISEVDGAVRGSELLAFPSLCRGGLHYAELLALEHASGSAGNERISLIDRSDALASALFAIMTDDGRPLVGKLLVDLAGADGTEPMFQPEFQRWLSNVMRVGIEAVSSKLAKPTNDYLTAALSLQRDDRDGGGALSLPADAIPSLSVLTSASAGRGPIKEVILPLIVADSDPAQPATLFQLPRRSTPALNTKVADYPSTWPRLASRATPNAAGDSDVGAIRLSRRPLPSEAELLSPIAATASQIGHSGQPITWLVFPEDWGEEVLSQGLELLSLQSRPDALRLMLIGDVPPITAVMAERFFGERVSISPDIMAALGGIQTPLIGYAGENVLLHNAQTTQMLSKLLQDPAVVSSSCVLLSTDRRGKGWQVSIADSGTFAPGRDRSVSPDVRLLWRMTYPTVRPPRDLWVGRSNTVAGWLQRAGPLRPEEGIHVCTSLVTASYAGGQNDRPAHVRPPASSEECATRIEALFG